METVNAKIGVADLEGPAVEKLLKLKDDNHADAADSEQALRNFDSFAESFFSRTKKFIESAKN